MANTMGSSVGDPMNFRERKSTRFATLCRAPCQATIFSLGAHDSLDGRSINYASVFAGRRPLALGMTVAGQSLSRWETASLRMRK
jgi:hypothetical protein